MQVNPFTIITPQITRDLNKDGSEIENESADLIWTLGKFRYLIAASTAD